MTTNPATKRDRPTMWQRTLQSFLGLRVRVKLRGGTYLKGELKNPQPYSVHLELLTGKLTEISYDTLLEVEAAK